MPTAPPERARCEGEVSQPASTMPATPAQQLWPRLFPDNRHVKASSHHVRLYGSSPVAAPFCQKGSTRQTYSGRVCPKRNGISISSHLVARGLSRTRHSVPTTSRGRAVNHLCVNVTLMSLSAGTHVLERGGHSGAAQRDGEKKRRVSTSGGGPHGAGSSCCPQGLASWAPTSSTQSSRRPWREPRG